MISNRYMRQNASKFISEIELQQIAPSVFAMSSAEKTSDKYALIPTIEAVRGLKDVGFFPVWAQETRCRDVANKPFAKHMMRFRQQNSVSIDGVFPEIVLINSHDGTSSYQLRAGLFRLVCSNGLVVGNEYFCHKVRHQGNVVEKVVSSASDLLENFPKTIEISNAWKQIELNPSQQVAFAESASLLKWDEDLTPIAPSRLLEARRTEDIKKDVWTTFNVIQENLIKGGKTYRTREGSRQRTRGINSVAENNRLNTALWKLTERLAEAVTA
jgi:hypothetical protein